MIKLLGLVGLVGWSFSLGATDVFIVKTDCCTDNTQNKKRMPERNELIILILTSKVMVTRILISLFL